MVVIKQPITLSSTFPVAHNQRPACTSSSVSKLKVEKVLKPPQKPTAIRIFTSGVMYSFVVARPTNKPRIKQAVKFTINVPLGNGGGKN